MDTKKQKVDKQENIAEPETNDVVEQKDDIEVKYKQEVEEYKSKYARALADYQNLEKRVREERSEWIKNAGRQILLNLLPIFDTLTMASKHSEDQNLLISIAQFLDALKAEGVSRIETKGKTFDPMLMECIQTVNGEENKVVDEIRAGFMLHDKLLRPAEVNVGKENAVN